MTIKRIEPPEGFFLRPQEVSDTNFLYSSFIQGQWQKGWLLDRRNMTWQQAMPAIQEILDNVMWHPGFECVVLCEKAFMDSIQGFILFSKHERKRIVYWIYIKERCRGLKLSRALWSVATEGLEETDPVYVASLTGRARNILELHHVNFQFRPSCLFSPNPFQTRNERLEERKEERYLTLEAE